MQSKPPALIPAIILLFILLAFSFLRNLGFLPIHLWDEGRVVLNSLNMHLNGNWMVTHFEGKPDMVNLKPPLLVWLQVICMKIFGVSEWSVRFPSATASILTGLTLFVFCRAYFKRIWPGFLAGCVFASTYSYVFTHAGRTGDYDALLTLFNTLYCLSFYLFCRSNNNKWLISFFAFLILAVLTKGIAGLFFTPSLFIYAVIQKKLVRILNNKWLYIGIASFLFIAVGYYVLREHYSPGYLKAVWEGELASYPKTLSGNTGPFWYYVENMGKWRYYFWVLFLIPAFAVGFFSHSKKVKSITLFHSLLVVIYLLIISTANTKVYWYDIPIYPFLSIQIGIMLYACWLFLQKKLMLSDWKLKLIVASCCFALIFVYPFRLIYTHNKPVLSGWPMDLAASDHEEAWFLQQAIRNNKDLNDYTFCYDGGCEGCHGHIDFYVLLLQSKHVNIRFQENLESLKRGRYIVVSQPAMRQKLESSYAVQLEKQEFGCYVYSIK